MSLTDLQRALQDTCLAQKPNPEALQVLGDSGSSWLVYRHMVRRRFYQELKTVFKRTHAAVGEAFFDAAFEHAMAHRPPRTRFFHLVPVEFAAHMADFFKQSTEIPAYGGDLLRFEARRREVANLPGTLPEEAASAVKEFDFDHPVAVNPTARLLRLDHPVHETASDPQAGYAKTTTLLVLYRPSDAESVRHFRINPVTYDLLAILIEQPTSMSAAVKTVSARRELIVDAAFLDALCTVLCDFIERRLILGSMQPSQ